MNYAMIIAYDGTRYQGWQKLGDTNNTIQEKIEAVFRALFEEPVDVHGAGRTDAGVHAEAQAAQFRLPDSLPGKVTEALAPYLSENGLFPDALRAYLNRYLPDDIGILSIHPVPPRFHSRFDAEGKIYTYRLTDAMEQHVFDRRFLSRYVTASGAPGNLKDLDLAAMRTAAAFLTGTHDFKSFCGNPHMKKSTVRTLYSIDFLEKPYELDLVFHGEGFLQYMVRILTGTLLMVGEGRILPEEIPAILEAKDRRAAGKTAPPEGLTLTKVIYPSAVFPDLT